jgi:hypothetical protein
VLYILFLSFSHGSIFASDGGDAYTEIDPTSTPMVTPTIVVNDDFQKYLNDYLYQKDLYQKAYLKYIEKKQVHTKYATLTTKQDKIDATNNYLVTRNNMQRSYLVALRYLLNKYKSIDPTETEKLQIDIQKWESWFAEQNTVVTAINNEDDFKKYSLDYKIKYITIQQLIYTALTRNQVNQKKQTLNTINTLMTDIQNSPVIKPESQEWIGPLTVKNDLVNTSLTTAMDTTNTKQYSTNFSNFYPDAQKEINKVNSYLFDMVSSLKSVVIKFKTTE